MKFPILFVLFALFGAYYCMEIIATLDTDDFQQVTQILFRSQLIYRERNKKSVMYHARKVTVSLIHLAGLTMSMFCASMLAVRYELNFAPFQAVTSFSNGNTNMNNITYMNNNTNMDNITRVVNTTNTAATPVDTWGLFFGCENNVCWRTCFVSVPHTVNFDNNTEQFCFTTPNAKTRSFYHCEYDEECAPNWECFGECEERELRRCETKIYKH